MILILCTAADVDALWLGRRLARRGEDVEVVTVESLAAARLEHRIEPTGPSVVLDLADGRHLDGRSASLVVNRMTGIPPLPVEHVAPGDRTYAEQELWAVTLGWLAALDGLVANPPSPAGLWGPARTPLAWQALAARAGLRVGRTADGPDRWLFVAGDVVVDPGPSPLPRSTVDAAVTLAALAGAPLLAVVLARTAGAWCFVGADLVAPLHLGGEPLVDAVVAMAARREGWAA